MMETRPSALSLHVLVRITPSASVVAQHRRVARQRRRPWRTSTRAGPRPPRRPSPPARECSGLRNDNIGNVESSCVASCVASRASDIDSTLSSHPPTNLAFFPFVLSRRPPRILISISSQRPFPSRCGSSNGRPLKDPPPVCSGFGRGLRPAQRIWDGMPQRSHMPRPRICWIQMTTSP